MRTPAAHARLAARLTALAALALLGACAGPGGGEGEDSVPWLVRHGRFDEAVELAARRSERWPDDERSREEHRMASAAWYMERGRRLCFEDRNEEALQAFHAARAIAPDEPIVASWVAAASDRLADEWLERGLERHNADDLQGAIEAYEKALSIVPDHDPTRETLARALLQQNYRRGMGEEYYDNGVRALDRYFLHEAHSLFTYVLKYEPLNERAEGRGEQTEELLAAERAAMAAEIEAEGDFSAARNEYRLALLLAPELEPARNGFERMQKEEQVAELLRTVERLFLQGRFDDAEAKLAEAAGVSERQEPLVEARRGELRTARLEAQYRAARTLESDHRYEEAVAAYDHLLAGETFFRDAIARRDTLQSYVEQARELYGRFEAAANDEERLALLRQIAVFWPEYRDVRLRLAELEGAPPGGR